MIRFPNGPSTYGTSHVLSNNIEVSKINKLVTNIINNVDLSNGSLVTHMNDGFMSSTDKIKLDTSSSSGYIGAQDRIIINNIEIDISPEYTGQESITIVGTLTKGLFDTGFSIIPPSVGGTGVNNGTNTITLNDHLTTGNHPLTLNTSTITNITLPESGTLVTTDDIKNYIGTQDRITIVNNIIDISPVYQGQESITTVGTLMKGSLDIGFDIIPPSIGGTGVNNGTNIITLNNHLIITGNHPLTLNTVDTTNITFPETGTLITIDDISNIQEYTGVQNRININNNANTIDISPEYTGQESITTVGTLTKGSLSSTFDIISPEVGGTGQSSYTIGDLLYADNNNTLAKLSGNTTTVKKFLTQIGTGTISSEPRWEMIDVNDIPGHKLTYSFSDQQYLKLEISSINSFMTSGEIHGSWQGLLTGDRGGTGVNNGNKTITVGGRFLMNGLYDTTLNTIGPTNLIIPTTGTLATTDDILNDYTILGLNKNLRILIQTSTMVSLSSYFISVKTSGTSTRYIENSGIEILKPGLYSITFTLTMITNSDASYNAMITINGNINTRYGWTTTNIGRIIDSSIQLYLNVGDYIGIVIWQNIGEITEIPNSNPYHGIVVTRIA